VRGFISVWDSPDVLACPLWVCVCGWQAKFLGLVLSVCGGGGGGGGGGRLSGLYPAKMIGSYARFTTCADQCDSWVWVGGGGVVGAVCFFFFLFPFYFGALSSGVLVG